jgi:uncharacterized membrane protein YqiK
VRIRAQADEERYRVEAEGKRAINEARNALSADQVQLEIKLELIRGLPQIIEQSVKPMERIEGIKIIDVRGMGGVAGANGGGDGGDGGLAGAVVDHALRYRAQRPLVDALLKEIGLGDVGDLRGLVATEPAAVQASTGATVAPTAPPSAAPGAKPKPA